MQCNRYLNCGWEESEAVSLSQVLKGICRENKETEKELERVRKLEPFDEFVTQMPTQINELALYVDDFIMLFMMRECDVAQREKAIQSIRMLVGLLDKNDSPVKKAKRKLKMRNM